MEEIVKDSSLLETVMAYFGWYKVKKVELEFDNLQITYTFNKEPLKTEAEWPFPAPKAKRKPALKKATTRKGDKDGN